MDIQVKNATFLQPPCFYTISNLAGNDMTSVVGYIFFSVAVNYQLHHNGPNQLDIIQPNENIITSYDGPSVPQILRSFTSPLTFFNEGLVHDYLYSDTSYDLDLGANRIEFEHTSGITWTDTMRKHYADQIFDALLLTNTVISPTQRKAIVAAVKKFGDSAFRSAETIERNALAIDNHQHLGYFMPKPPSSLYAKFKT